jgi:hypothetical protein
LLHFKKAEGVVFVGVAQEKVRQKGQTITFHFFAFLGAGALSFSLPAR